MANEDFETELQREVAERLALMETPSYEYPRPLGRIDWMFIVAIPIISLCLLVIGEFL